MPNEGHIIMGGLRKHRHVKPPQPKTISEMMDAKMRERPEQKLFEERRGNWTKEQAAREAISQMANDAVGLQRRQGVALPSYEKAHSEMTEVARKAEVRKEG